MRFIQLLSEKKKAKSSIRAIRREDFNKMQTKRKEKLFAMMKSGNEKRFFNDLKKWRNKGTDSHQNWNSTIKCTKEIKF